MNQKKVIVDQQHGGKRWRENICRDTCPSVHNDIACAVCWDSSKSNWLCRGEPASIWTFLFRHPAPMALVYNVNIQTN